MKHRALALSFAILAILLTVGLISAIAAPLQEPDRPALVQISWQSPADLALVEASGATVYARLAGESGPYLLAGAVPGAVKALRSQGLAVAVLDADPKGASYYLAYPAPGRAQPDWTAYGRPLLDDGVRVLLRASARAAEPLAGLGIGLQALSLDPKPLWPAGTRGLLPRAVISSPHIQAMIDGVDADTLYQSVGDLSGEWPVLIGGEPYTLSTRYTDSGEPVEKATQYAAERLAALGLDVEVHQWDEDRPPNVIGELWGETHPYQVAILSAHLDSITYQDPMALAPGADDNASGAAALLLAADLLTDYRWGCTLRFALWTGEEQGLLGSQAYAQRASDAGEIIAGVLNLDMIAWNSPEPELNQPDIDLHAGLDMVPGSMALAQLFSDAVGIYGLDLVPEILPNGMTASDHYPFWLYGYPALLAIEDYYPNRHDFNPYYHTDQDLLEHLDLSYFSEFARASIATFAHMGCLLPHGTLTGQVTEAGTGAPIAGAAVTLRDTEAYTYTARTGATGHYTQTAVAGIYTVAVSAPDFVPASAAGVAVLSDAITVRDFALSSPLFTYLPLVVREVEAPPAP